MLQIEQYNLRKWGRKAGLRDRTLEKRLPEEEDRAMALMVLRQVVETVAETEGLRKRYGLRLRRWRMGRERCRGGRGGGLGPGRRGCWAKGVRERTESTATSTLVLGGSSGSGSGSGSGGGVGMQMRVGKLLSCPRI